MSINKVILVGNLGKDPELRHTASGTVVCNFSLATTDRFKNKQGEQQDKTEWHNIVAWSGLAEICGKYLTKGKQVYIEGRIQNRTYDDRDGNKRYISEIVASEMQMLGQRSGKELPNNPIVPIDEFVCGAPWNESNSRPHLDTEDDFPPVSSEPSPCSDVPSKLSRSGEQSRAQIDDSGPRLATEADFSTVSYVPSPYPKEPF